MRPARYRPGAMWARLRAGNRCASLAARWARLDRLGQLGDPTAGALRLARCRALALGCPLDDVQDATMEGLTKNPDPS